MPVHRALTEPILLGGAPRAVAILNGTLAAALGLGLAAMARRSLARDSSVRPPRCGRRSAIRNSSTSCAGIFVSPAIWGFKPMMNLAEYRRSTTQLADFLPWAALVDEGIVLNKDGSFQRTAKFRGPDLDSAVPAELVGVAGRLNNALRRLGSGWAVFVEAQRHPASKYPEGHFPDVASALVDVERRAQFEQEGAHYESSYFLTFLYLPPPEEAGASRALPLRGTRSQRRCGCARSPARIRRSHRARAWACRGLYARTQMAR